ncbi:hypothetical protein C2E23DRAFT_710553, partial [Lenzites betulinus]
MKAFIRELLGFDPSGKDETGGVLGNVKAYYGCVEAQGRGTLHCHMMVWIEGGLSPNDLQQRLKGEDGVEFGQRLIHFLDDVISNDVPDEPPDSVDDPPYPAVHPDSHRGFPLHMEGPILDAFRKRDIRELVLVNQSHSHTATCYKYCGDGPRKCRFDLEKENVIPTTTVDSETGELTLRIVNGMINNYNPTMLEGLRCNMDIQFIGSGEEAKAVIYYITDYITKSPLKAHVSYAALELAIRRLAETDSSGGSLPDSRERSKRLLQRTAFALISNQELSAPQVASYLMEFEDHFTSHRYANLYWTSFERFVDHVQPCRSSSHEHTDDAPLDADHAGNGADSNDPEPMPSSITGDDAGLEEVAISSTPDGTIVQLSSQLMDYTHRGNSLRALSVWDYVATIRK